MHGRPYPASLALACALAFVAIAGCQTQTATQTSAADQARLEANKTAYRRLVEQGISQGDTTLVDSLLTENVVDHEAMEGMPPGRAGLKWFITSMHAAYPDLKLTVNDVAAEGDKVWGYLTITGTQKGEFMGMAPTGKQVDIDGFDLVRFENGRIAEHWGVTDNMKMMQQLGMTPAAGAAHRP